MNLLKQIKAFAVEKQAKQLSAGQISLYYALLDIDNELCFKEWFNAATATLELRCGLTRSGIIHARNELKQQGLIDFKARKGSKSTEYKLIPLGEHETEYSGRGSDEVKTRFGRG